MYQLPKMRIAAKTLIVIILRFDKAKVAKTKRILSCNKSNKIWNVDVDNADISKLIKTKRSSKDLNGYLDEVIRPLILISH